MKSGFREDIVLNLRHNRNTNEDASVSGSSSISTADGLDIIAISYSSPVLALPRACDHNKVCAIFSANYKIYVCGLHSYLLFQSSKLKFELVKTN